MMEQLTVPRLEGSVCFGALYHGLQKFVLSLSIWSPDGIIHVINSTVLGGGKRLILIFL